MWHHWWRKIWPTRAFVENNHWIIYFRNFNWTNHNEVSWCHNLSTRLGFHRCFCSGRDGDDDGEVVTPLRACASGVTAVALWLAMYSGRCRIWSFVGDRRRFPFLFEVYVIYDRDVKNVFLRFLFMWRFYVFSFFYFNNVFYYKKT